MNIIDNKGLLSVQWYKDLQAEANRKLGGTLRLNGYSSLDDIHSGLGIEVIISEETKSYKMFDAGKDDRLIALYKRLDALYETLKNNPNNLSIREAIEKTLSQISRLDNHKCNVVILGEYVRDENCIYLYVKTIKNTHTNPADQLKCLISTYIHEMMHVYFDRDRCHSYIFEVEEALAEAGVLLYMDDTSHPYLTWAKQNISSNNIQAYCQGATIYDMWKGGMIDLPKRIEDYRNAFDCVEGVRLISVLEGKDVVCNNSVPVAYSMRNAFEVWLLNAKRCSPSTAVEKACALPLRIDVREALINVAHTDNLYNVRSLTELINARSCLGSSSYSSTKIYKEKLMIENYIEFLDAEGLLLP